MADLQILEGTGRELLPQLEQNPELRFRLIPLPAETQEVKPIKELKGRGMLRGHGTIEDFLRRKREDLEWEERNSPPRTEPEQTVPAEPVKRSRSYGILKGLTNSEDFMRRKQEEIELEESKFR